MAERLSAQLAGKKFTANRLETTATVTLEQVAGNWTISKIHLDLTAQIPGISKADFDSLATAAKEGCPVSRLFKAEITLDAKLS